MAKLTEIEATYRVVTPMFCAGADPRRAEIRLSSFKGVLRFWWRALAWSRLNGDLEKIQQEEDALFGSANGGQSRVSMSLASGSISQMVSKNTVLNISKTNGRVVGQGARYLGYGVMKAFGSGAGELIRACLHTPFDFTVQMRGRDLRNQQLDLLKDALVSLGTFGGMGAKSRNGYGSLVIRTLRVNGQEGGSRPQSITGLCNAIKVFQSNDNVGGLPKITALSAKARHILLSSHNREPLELLDLIGRELVRYRSWGHRGKYQDGIPKILGNIPSEKNFQYDHDLMKLQHRKRSNHPQRIAFGLPHNYGPGTHQQVRPIDFDRRASPLFIHIHECGGTPIAVLSFLPAQFLPKRNSDISVGGRRVSQTPEDRLYKPIHEFLDRLVEGRHEEPFTDVKEVKL